MKTNRIKMSGVILGQLYFILIFSLGFFNAYNSSILNFDSNIFKFNLILNQGWAFFTKNPRDVQTYVFKDGKSVLVPLTHPRNFFGFKRNNSRISFEVGQVVKECKDRYWKKTISNEYKGNYLKVKSPLKNSKIRGKIIVVNYERVPWAWSKYNKSFNFIKTYIKLEIF